MKLIFIAAVVVLTVAHATGHFIPNEQDKLINLNQYFNNMKARVNQDMSERIKNHNLPAQARSILERQQGELKVPEQVKELFSEAEKNFHNVMDGIREKVGDFWQKVAEQAGATHK